MQTSRLVVLAAGVGSRLQHAVRAKPLVRIGGMTLLERSIVAGTRPASSRSSSSLATNPNLSPGRPSR